MYKVVYYTAPNALVYTDAMSLETAFMVFNLLMAEYDKVKLFNIETNRDVAVFEWAASSKNKETVL